MKFFVFGLISCVLFIGLLATGVGVIVSALPGVEQSAEANTTTGAEKLYQDPVTSIEDDDIVSVQGIQVHQSIANNVAALLEQARSDGLNLDAWGYRPTSRQIELRIKHCGGNNYYAIYEKPSGSCSPPTASPGNSQHEVGLALDFKNCSNRSTTCYRWLASNAAKFGLKNLPSEAWHWSTTGR